MKYSEFEKKINALGDKYSVRFDEYFVKVYYHGEEVGRIVTNMPFNIVMHNCHKIDWGSNQLDGLCYTYCSQLAGTLVKNRGRLPKDIEPYQGRVII